MPSFSLADAGTQLYPLFKQVLASCGGNQLEPVDELHIKKLFEFIASSPEGEAFLASTIAAASKLRLVNIDANRPSTGNPGFAHETKASLTVTGFYIYLIFDVRAPCARPRFPT